MGELKTIKKHWEKRKEKPEWKVVGLKWSFRSRLYMSIYLGISVRKDFSHNLDKETKLVRNAVSLVKEET